jgi:hypothetical protein
MSRRRNKGQKPRKLDGGVIQKLRQMLSKYKYRLAGVLEDKCTFTYNEETGRLMVNPSYRYLDLPKEGSCLELMFTAYKQIRKQMPDVHVYRVSGTEPSFFPKGHHAFLLVVAYDAMPGISMSTQLGHKMEILKADPILVDPSFRRTGRLKRFDYNIFEIQNHDYTSYLPAGIVIGEHETLPLLYSSGELMLLGCSPDGSSVIDIHFRTPNRKEKPYDLNSPTLDARVAGNAEQLEFVRALRQKEIKTTDERLYVDFDVALK